jgi:ATP-dependent RNA helicase RhlE
MPVKDLTTDGSFNTTAQAQGFYNVDVEDERDFIIPENIRQCVYFVDREDKIQLLLHILKEGAFQHHILVFTATKYGADKIAAGLNRAGISAEAFHSDKSRRARERALQDFQDRVIKVLVATDISAREIEVNSISCIINYDLPLSSETYIYRIEKKGTETETNAVLLCDQEEKGFLKNINRLAKQDISVISSHPYA